MAKKFKKVAGLKRLRQAPDELDLANVRITTSKIYRQMRERKIDAEEAAKQIREQTTKKRTLVDLLIGM